MDPRLTINSDEARLLAEELAAVTGEDVTTAVTSALRERLERARAVQNFEVRLRGLRAITARIREEMADRLPSSDHSWLYDDSGLPG